MRIDWRLSGEYEDAGGETWLRGAVQEAIAHLPREHLRRMDTLIVQDDDPKGRSLGLWRQDGTGCAIELYVLPHIRALSSLPAPVRDFALRLHLAYTIFHEVGHHVTRYLNRRSAPPRKAPIVEEKIECWADEYAEKRIGRLCEHWLSSGGRADSPAGRRALGIALRALRLEGLPALPESVKHPSLSHLKLHSS